MAVGTSFFFNFGETGGRSGSGKINSTARDEIIILKYDEGRFYNDLQVSKVEVIFFSIKVLKLASANLHQLHLEREADHTQVWDQCSECAD